MSALELRVPRLKDMPYRQALLAQRETMAYNAGRGEGIEGYDNATGCIDFPMGDWRYWRQIWLDSEPTFFSALLWNEEEGCFVGETCYFYDDEAQAHTAGILIEARHRGRGYCAQGLRLLAARAFAREEVARLVCPLNANDKIALRGYRAAGFREVSRVGGQCLMVLQREI